MTCYICETCGIQFGESAAPPAQCAICCDERQYVGPSGQSWTSAAKLTERHSIKSADDDGLPGIGLSPAFAINQRALVARTATKSILWECLSVVTPEAVAQLTADGPIDTIAISHPHFYAAMVDWSNALGGVPILIHESDRQWIARPSPRIELWRGEAYALSEGARLIRCGGHFPGSAALHWQDERRPAGVLFSGDALQVSADRRHVSFMYSYPNNIPMHPDAVRAMRKKLEGLRFDDVFGYTWKRNIVGGARAAVDKSFDRYLHAIGAHEPQRCDPG